MTLVAHAEGDRGSAKLTRQNAILSLIQKHAIRTQEELVEALRRRRLHATQATVSRDIRELRLARVHDREGGRYIATPSAQGRRAVEAYATQLAAIFADHVLDIEFVDHIGVIHTRPSSAPLVASALDTGNHEEIAGTVAGDDTVLVITRGTAAARALRIQLAKLLGKTA